MRLFDQPVDAPAGFSAPWPPVETRWDPPGETYEVSRVAPTGVQRVPGAGREWRYGGIRIPVPDALVPDVLASGAAVLVHPLRLPPDTLRTLGEPPSPDARVRVEWQDGGLVLAWEDGK